MDRNSSPGIEEVLSKTCYLLDLIRNLVENDPKLQSLRNLATDVETIHSLLHEIQGVLEANQELLTEKAFEIYHDTLRALLVTVNELATSKNHWNLKRFVHPLWKPELQKLAARLDSVRRALMLLIKTIQFARYDQHEKQYTKQGLGEDILQLARHVKHKHQPVRQKAETTAERMEELKQNALQHLEHGQSSTQRVARKRPNSARYRPLIEVLEKTNIITMHKLQDLRMRGFDNRPQRLQVSPSSTSSSFQDPLHSKITDLLGNELDVRSIVSILLSQWTILSSDEVEVTTSVLTTSNDAVALGDVLQDPDVSPSIARNLPLREKSNSSLRPYQYRVLQNRCIRLIRVEPGKPDDDLRCSLIEAPIEGLGARYFEALSYTWGDTTIASPVPCGSSGEVVYASLNCVSALKALRFETQPRTLWIDALCINQSDIKERNGQVRLMADIYRNASRVLIYLGEDGDCSDEAMEYLRGDLEIEAKNEPIIKASVPTLLERPWFGRVWVLQEVAMSRSATVICGRKSAPWSCFTSWASRNQSTQRPGILSYGSGSSPIRGSLLQQLLATKQTNATDPRDKVIALLGLLGADEYSLYGPVIDYRLETPMDVYTKTTSLMLQHDKSLAMLSAVQGNTGPIDHPSWVPDWNKPALREVFGLGPQYSEPYDAGGRPAAGIKIRANVLYAKGILIDQISTVGTTMEILNASLDYDPNYIFQTLRSWWQLLVSQSADKCPSLELLFKRIITTWNIDAVEGDQEPGSAKAPWFSTSSQPPTSFDWTTTFPSPDRVCLGRRIFFTADGFIGLAPAEAEPGDVICVLLGGPTPYVLRPVDAQDQSTVPDRRLSGLSHGFPSSHEQYILVGECYVYRLMNGEALAHLRDQLGSVGHISFPADEMPCQGSLRTFAIR